MKRQEFDRLIDGGNFAELFIAEMGWNNPANRQTLPIGIDGLEYAFVPVAEKSGFQVYSCTLEELPTASACKKIDNQLRRYSNDYICIFAASGTAHHLWLTPVKTNEKRELVKTEYENGAKADFLFSKVDDFSFALDEKVLITDVKSRVQGSFHLNSEKVTKDFYTQFRREHKSFTSHIQGLEDEKERDWYTSVMLNRLMFCYFIQKKGFLDGDKNYLQTKLRWVKERQGEDQFFGTFYKSFLSIMFHDGLNAPNHDSEDFVARYGRIPYLNGGMFDEHQLEREYKGIDIADKAFEDLFDFFDKWEWHLDTRLTASGKDINPDVLGYIFEQYINDRAAMGAYYTKEDITEYIGKNCIIPFLMDKTAAKSAEAFKPNGFVWNLLRESGGRYIYDAVRKGHTSDWQSRLPDYIAQGIDTQAGGLLERRARWNEKAFDAFALPTEIWRETIERLQRCDSLLEKIAGGELQHINDFITYNLDIRQFCEDVLRNTDDHLLVKHFYEALQGVTILDPTCGSGAFLFAALNILEPLYEACLDRMEEFHRAKETLFKKELEEIAVKYSSNRQYFIYKSIILRNLYGVDIMVEATEIAKLRLFLKMVAVVEVDRRKENLGLDPLPDIDFNIRCGNTLVGYATEAELNKDLSFAKDILEELANQELKEKIEQEMKLVSAAYENFRSEQLKSYDDDASIKRTKKELKKRLDALNELLNKRLYISTTGHTSKDGEADFEYYGWEESHQPFHWLAEFYQIIKGNGGFDVIIGNPPYVVYTKKDKITQKSVADKYSINGYKTIECNNLFGFVMERSHNILNDEERMGMIVPLSFTAAKNMLSLRNLFTNDKNLYVSSYEIRPAKLFDGGKGAEQRLNIFILHKSNTSSVKTTSVQRWHSEHRNILFKTLHYSQSISNERILRFSDSIENSILTKYNRDNAVYHMFANSATQNIVHYRSAGMRYWIIFLNNGFGTESASNKFKYVIGKEEVKQLMAVLNSNLYWWYYATNYDMFNQTDANISDFRFTYDPTINLCELAEELEADMDANKNVSIITKKDGNVNASYAYQKKLSKSIIDEIDKVLAKHYGFTEEELDFIINYDIKYRMGDELGGEEE